MKLWWQSLVAMLLMCGLIAGVIYGARDIFVRQGVFERVKVGLINQDQSAETRLLFGFIESMDSVKSICTFEMITEEVWDKQLSQQDFQAVISLPENFYTDVYQGMPLSVTLYLPEHSPLNTQLFTELIGDGLGMARIAYAGVLTAAATAEEIAEGRLLAESGMRAYHVCMDMNALTDMIAMAYLHSAFARGDLFEQVIISPFGSYNMYQYYLLAVLAVLLLFSGMRFYVLYERRSRVIHQKMRILGLGAGWITIEKVLVMGISLYLDGWILTGLGAGVAYIARMHGLRIYLDGLQSGSGLISYSFVLLLICFVLAAWLHLLFSLGGAQTGAMLHIVSGLLMMLSCGMVLPVVYLNVHIRQIGHMVPLRWWYEGLCLSITGESVGGLWVVIMIGMMVVFGIFGGLAQCWQHGSDYN